MVRGGGGKGNGLTGKKNKKNRMKIIYKKKEEGGWREK